MKNFTSFRNESRDAFRDASVQDIQDQTYNVDLAIDGLDIAIEYDETIVPKEFMRTYSDTTKNTKKCWTN